MAKQKNSKAAGKADMKISPDETIWDGNVLKKMANKAKKRMNAHPPRKVPTDDCRNGPEPIGSTIMTGVGMRSPASSSRDSAPAESRGVPQIDLQE